MNIRKFIESMSRLNIDSFKERFLQYVNDNGIRICDVGRSGYQLLYTDDFVSGYIMDGDVEIGIRIYRDGHIAIMDEHGTMCFIENGELLLFEDTRMNVALDINQGLFKALGVEYDSE